MARNDVGRRAEAPITAPVYGQTTTPEQQWLQQQQYGMAQSASRAYGQQQDVYKQLQAQANGTAGPSMAQQQQAAMAQANVANLMGAQAQARGTNMASQARAASGMGAAAAMQQQQQMAQMQLAEQQAAMQALQQQANVMGGQQLGASQFATGTAQQANQFMAQQQLQAAMADQQAAQQQQQNNRGFGLNVFDRAAGGAGQLAQGAMMFSDERVKDIEDFEADAEAIAAAKELRSTKYRYKPGTPDVDTDEDILGIVTTDLRKTPAGRQIVVPKPDGDRVSLAGGVSLALAAVGALARKVDEARDG